jgi:hypothetical protein
MDQRNPTGDNLANQSDDRIAPCHAALREWADRHNVAKQGNAPFDRCEKRRQLLRHVDAIAIAIPRMPWETLTQVACDHYNKANRLRGIDTADPGSSPREFVSRITVNYLRHQCTPYDEELERLSGGEGKQEAVEVLKGRVLGAIAEQYPELAKECDRQMSDWLDEKAWEEVERDMSRYYENN